MCSQITSSTMISHYLCKYLLWNCKVSMELDLQAMISTWNCDFKMCNIENFYSYNFLIGVLLLQFISKQWYFFFFKFDIKIKIFPWLTLHSGTWKGLQRKEANHYGRWSNLEAQTIWFAAHLLRIEEVHQSELFLLCQISISVCFLSPFPENQNLNKYSKLHVMWLIWCSIKHCSVHGIFFSTLNL